MLLVGVGDNSANYVQQPSVPRLYSTWITPCTNPCAAIIQYLVNIKTLTSICKLLILINWNLFMCMLVHEHSLVGTISNGIVFIKKSSRNWIWQLFYFSTPTPTAVSATESSIRTLRLQRISDGSELAPPLSLPCSNPWCWYMWACSYPTVRNSYEYKAQSTMKGFPAPSCTQDCTQSL